MTTAAYTDLFCSSKPGRFFVDTLANTRAKITMSAENTKIQAAKIETDISNHVYPKETLRHARASLAPSPRLMSSVAETDVHALAEAITRHKLGRLQQRHAHLVSAAAASYETALATLKTDISNFTQMLPLNGHFLQVSEHILQQTINSHASSFAHRLSDFRFKQRQDQERKAAKQAAFVAKSTVDPETKRILDIVTEQLRLLKVHKKPKPQKPKPRPQRAKPKPKPKGNSSVATSPASKPSKRNSRPKN
jgi:hypothetical protein